MKTLHYHRELFLIYTGGKFEIIDFEEYLLEDSPRCCHLFPSLCFAKLFVGMLPVNYFLFEVIYEADVLLEFWFTDGVNL